jgi:hypothetical protein
MVVALAVTVVAIVIELLEVSGGDDDCKDDDGACESSEADCFLFLVLAPTMEDC